MDKQTTHVAIILDRSGSMWRTKAATVRGYNEQVQQIKEDAQDKNHDIFVSLVTFNGSVTEHLWDVPAEQLEEASEEDFIPKGSTAMRDALGHTIQKLLDTTDSDDKDTAYLVCVITDGEENSSKHFGAPALKELIESVQNSDRWTINYMGCDETYLKRVAKETSVPVANCAVWANDTVRNTDFAMNEMSGKLGGYFKMRSSGKGMSSQAFHNVSGDAKVDNYVQPTGGKLDYPDGTVKLDDGMQNFDDGMQNFGVTDLNVPVIPMTGENIVKTGNNVFGKGNSVDSAIWKDYVSRGTTTPKE